MTTPRPGSRSPRSARIVHLGVGAFHRAHQAWYTAHAPGEWGIVAYTGRTPSVARALAAQAGRYTLIERDQAGDRAEVIDVITDAVDGADLAHLRASLSRPEVSVVTLTITEAGYGMRHGRAAQVLEDDAAAARADPSAVRSPIGRLAVALEARRRADGGPVTLVPCDNLPDNGAVVRDALLIIAERLGPATEQYVRDQVGFVSTSVDRITPRTTADDRAAAFALTGFHDRIPVVTEPFSDWILEDTFRSDRPVWELAGARIVPRVTDYERRKLWLLNGAHTLLAIGGPLRGHTTIDQAFSDPRLAEWVEEFWDECEAHFPVALEIAEYRGQLRRRFSNNRIQHALAQIATDTPTKLGVRITPVLRAERAKGRRGVGSARTIAAWIAARIEAASPRVDQVRHLVAGVDEPLAEDDEVLSDITDLVAEQRYRIGAVAGEPRTASTRTGE